MTINIMDYVGTADGDVTAQVNAAADAARAANTELVLPHEATIQVEGQVNLRYIRRMDLSGIIKVGPDGMVTIGDNRNQRSDADIRIRRVSWVARDQTNICLRTVGLKSAVLHVGYCDYWQWYADPTADVRDQSSSYCTSTVGRINRFQIYCRKAPDGSDFGWITELLFIGGDWRNIEFDTDYIINQITWLKPCCEGGTIKIPMGHRIEFLSARGEGGTKLYLGKDSSRVVFEDEFSSNPLAMGTGAVVVQDEGVDNLIVSSFAKHYTRRTICHIDGNTPIVGGRSENGMRGLQPIPGSSTVQPRIASMGTFTTLLDTGLISVRGSGASPTSAPESTWRISRFLLSSDTAAFRLTLRAFDSAKSPLNDPGALLIGGGLKWKDGTWGHDVNVSEARFAIASPQVAYVQIEVSSGSPLTPFGWMRLDAFTLGLSSDTPITQIQRKLAQYSPASGKPSASIVGEGKTVTTDRTWRCVSRAETTVKRQATTGSAAVELETIDKVAVGDDIGIGSKLTSQWAKIVSINGTTVTLFPPLTEDVAMGSPVVVLRWQSDNPSYGG